MIMAMKMRNVLLLVAVTLAWTQLTAAVTLRACTMSYLTSNPSGADDAAGGPAPKGCTTANYKTACLGGFNAQCVFSLKSYSYICCYPIAGTAATVLGTATMATLYPGSTTGPRNLKPLCPTGSVGYGTSSLTCNSTARDAGCPVTYSCVKAVNIYDLSGTPTISTDDVGAANTPQVCCKTQATSDVYTAAGLGTSIIPVPPTDTLASVFFGTTPAATMYLGDDYSTTGVLYVSAPADGTAATAATVTLKSVVLYSPTADKAATTRYHLLLFDATTNTNCLFVGNILGTTDADKTNPTITLPTLASTDGTITTAGGQAAYSYVDYTLATPIQKFALGAAFARLASLNNNVAHKWVVLVWQTTAALNFGPTPTTAADETKILLGAGPYGDFVPATDATGAGPFTTVTAFLSKTKVKTILGTPIAGSYFYIAK